MAYKPWPFAKCEIENAEYATGTEYENNYI